VFLGREISRTQGHSDETARRIDVAVAQIVNEQFAMAEKIIAEHGEAHRKIAEALLEHETLDGIHIMEILKTGAIQTPVVGSPVANPVREANPAGPTPETGTQSSPSPA
jgi:cell division protease FtsH